MAHFRLNLQTSCTNAQHTGNIYIISNFESCKATLAE